MQLDVEGMELPALQGAEALLVQDHPLVVVELKHGARYGWTHNELTEWLRALGYTEADVCRNDWVYRFRGMA